MDHRERLRRYLEQRREMGETELVLDGMTVEQVMSILGARGSSSGQASTSRDSSRADSRSVGASAAGAPGDWREALRASGAAPEPGRPRPAVPDGGRGRAAAAERRSGGASAVDPVPPQASSSPTAADAIAKPKENAFEGGGASGGVADAPPGIVVGSAARELFGTPIGKIATLGEIAETVAGCRRCPLYATATNPVPGEGSPTARLVCVGEAPGANEDATGRPFVGQAGQLLTKILGAINLKREDVFICNVLKHRPPGNRNPAPEEVVACSPYLVQQIEIIRPRVIVAFGTFAAQTLLNTRLAIGKLRGSIHRYYGIPLIVTYHPAALLRNPAWKRPTWEDVQLARRILDSPP